MKSVSESPSQTLQEGTRSLCGPNSELLTKLKEHLTPNKRHEIGDVAFMYQVRSSISLGVLLFLPGADFCFLVKYGRVS